MNRHDSHSLESEIVIYHGACHARRGWMLAALALLLTAAMFVTLPFADLVTARPTATLDVRPASTVTVRAPPPPERLPVQTPEPAREQQTVLREMQKPELLEPAPRQRVVAPRLHAALNPAADLPVFSRTVELSRDTTQTTGWSYTPTVAEFRVDSSFGFGIEPVIVADASPELDEDDTTTVFETHELDRPPKPLLQTPPSYPSRARARNIEGYATVTFTVTPEGRPIDVHTVDAQPGQIFVKPAQQAVARWRFQPGERNGEPVSVRMQVTLRFKLKQ